MAMRVSNRSSSSNALLDEVHAWQVCPEELAARALRDRCFAWLSPDERTRYDQFPTKSLAHEYLTARVLCRTALSRHAGVHPSEWTFDKGLDGKPRIAGPDGFESLRFNLTHTDGLAICLVSDATEVGIDAEKTSSNVDDTLIARHFFSSSERERCGSLPMARRREWFFAQWVVKEAYLKGTGSGLDAPERITVEWGEDGQPLAIGGWHFFVYKPTSHHVAAAAVQQRGTPAVSTRWLKVEDVFQIETAR